MKVQFGSDGLIPAIVRDSRTGEVLTLAYMNEEALRLTEESGESWFWSRSRQELWHKGETSGNRQKVVAIRADCDQDAIVLDVEPLGPACHTGATSCFGETSRSTGHLEVAQLIELLKLRNVERPEGSYSTYLFQEGLDKILKKVGEEATEVVIAAKNGERERIVSEIADLVFHLSVLMVEKGLDPSEVNAELEGRRR